MSLTSCCVIEKRGFVIENEWDLVTEYVNVCWVKIWAFGKDIETSDTSGGT